MDEAKHVGWVFDLALDSEILVSDPVVYDGVLYYSTSLPSSKMCSAGDSMVMGQDACSGGQSFNPLFDLNGDELLSSKDSVVLFDMGAFSQVSGFVNTNSVSAPVIMSSGERDFIYVPKRIGEEDSIPGDDESLHSTWYPPGIEKTVTRGKNLGLYFWRELF